MQFGPGRAQFQHVAQDGDAAAARADRRPCPARSSAARHRGRIGVVALVDQQRFAAGNAERDRGRRGPTGACICDSASALCARSAPASDAAASTASEFIAMWRPGHAELVGDVMAEDVRMHGRARRVQRDVEQPRIGVACSPNVTMRSIPAFCAASRSRANCGLSRLSTAAPPGSTPEKISALASAIASIEPKILEMHRLDRGDRPPRAAAPSAPAARSRPRGSCRSRRRHS